ncbi:MAG: hypothetical protein KHX55_01620 [Proteobacteria bacterium]|nr:hypothetical protein [Pseudomonadota bacterium]
MYFEDKEEKHRRQTAQYINTPYGPARNPALGQNGTAAVNPYEVENPPSEKPDYWKNYAQDFGLLPRTANSLTQAMQSYENFGNDKIHNDKYKHSVVSCNGAQNGLINTVLTAGAGILKEGMDIYKKSKDLNENPNSAYSSMEEILNDSREDLKADFNGIKQGFLNPNKNCDEWMKRYYYPYWR